MRYIGLSLLILSSISTLAQPDCFRFDKKTNLAYNLEDSNLYTGLCHTRYKNGSIMSTCQFEKGLLKYTLRWNKKGELFSAEFFYNDKKYRSYLFHNNNLKSTATYYLLKVADDTINYYDYSDYTLFYGNGNKKRETVKLFDYKNRYTFKNYYRNGSIKESGLAYDKETLLKKAYTVQLDSVYYEYTKDGKLKSEIVYKDGKQVGEVKKYNDTKFEVALSVIAIIGGFLYLALDKKFTKQLTCKKTA